ncbi:hypothetical protein SFV1gp07 [Sulfolobus filamentous virus 1]|uniref:Uncharacterized protein n=2 Tax=Alphalipothrixvirus beppuense TaxID=2734584 RepID=A0A346LU46_SUFV1|nr:hypothetical protein HOT91_gp07 [Sulfolobus filamentous virus 1]AXQ00089.1 hypothetical protein SFV1gp07 [Sulfolobus filamentous virus 1]AZI75708.1 hypothetical protein SBFV1_gp07 [Sulfolobales Beppu filamentous phage 1]
MSLSNYTIYLLKKYLDVEVKGNAINIYNFKRLSVEDLNGYVVITAFFEWGLIRKHYEKLIFIISNQNVTLDIHGMTLRFKGSVNIYSYGDYVTFVIYVYE